ncbi:MAG: hypothetical protein DRO01_08145 [Thermoproteota archaeon]|nr:MAG: hypothetical protein DRO01_08145 [Candidatus Korarchaeota archaeon]
MGFSGTFAAAALFSGILIMSIIAYSAEYSAYTHYSEEKDSRDLRREERMFTEADVDVLYLKKSTGELAVRLENTGEEELLLDHGDLMYDGRPLSHTYSVEGKSTDVLFEGEVATLTAQPWGSYPEGLTDAMRINTSGTAVDVAYSGDRIYVLTQQLLRVYDHSGKHLVDVALNMSGVRGITASTDGVYICNATEVRHYNGTLSTVLQSTSGDFRSVSYYSGYIYLLNSTSVDRCSASTLTCTYGFISHGTPVDIYADGYVFLLESTHLDVFLLNGTYMSTPVTGLTSAVSVCASPSALGNQTVYISGKGSSAYISGYALNGTRLVSTTSGMSLSAPLRMDVSGRLCVLSQPGELDVMSTGTCVAYATHNGKVFYSQI